MCLLAFGAAMLLAQKPDFYYIPHTHWEGAVFLTREEYLQEDLKHILEALRLMERYPNYKFALDQVAYIKPFLERFPEQAARFRKYMKEGRLEVVGGMDVMPDVVKPGAESLVRQIQYGKNYCRKTLGFDVDVAWLLDTFGHDPSMPQILKQAGFKSFWFSRGVARDNVPSEFNWKGIDGTTIPAFWLPGFYGLLYYPPKDLTGFAKFFEDRYKFLEPHARPTERVGLAGGDVTEPEDWAPPLVDQFNARPDRPFNLKYAVPTDFANVVAKRKNTPTFDWDMNPIFPGTYSSRVELHQRAKTIETKLLDAEQLSVQCNLAGEHTDDAQIWQAWEPTLFNETHDLASGTMNDHVYIDTVKSFDYSERLADEVLADRFFRFAKHIDTRGPGIPVVVYNPQGWERSELVQVEVGFADNGVRSVSVTDSTPIQFQLDQVERYSDGALMKARVSFLARAPGCGWSVYSILPSDKDNPSAVTRETPGDTLETQITHGSIRSNTLRVKVDPKTGAVLSLKDDNISEALSAPANVIARLPDNGDLWELYHSLNGESHLPTMTIQPVPTSATALLSTACGGKPGIIRTGPVYSEFSVAYPFGKGELSTIVRVVRDSPRVEIETSVVNREPHVRYQALFPVAVNNGKQVQGIPFGSVERPLSVEYPAQDWIDFSDASHGVTLLNAALPGNLVSGNTMMLSLLRAVGEGDYNGGDTSDTGMELNVKRTMRYALVAHDGSVRPSAAAQLGQEFNSPFLVLKAEPHRGKLMPFSGLIGTNPDIVISSVKPGAGGGVVIRMFEASGKAQQAATVSFRRNIDHADETNLLEDPVRHVPFSGSDLRVDFRAFEIKTIKVKLR